MPKKLRRPGFVHFGLELPDALYRRLEAVLADELRSPRDDHARNLSTVIRALLLDGLAVRAQTAK